MAKIDLIAEPGKQETVYTRLIRASREMVFMAYIDSKMIAQWWGPKRYTTIVDRQDARLGGVWRFVNRDAGGEYAFHGVYHQVEAPTRIVSTFEYEGAPGHVSLETLTLESVPDGTKLTGHSVFQSVEDRDEMLRAGMVDGLSESLDRLERLLATIEIAEKV